tara:strand:- start:1870 stop:2334 length:465 start_codon:yes stop_codon:yes gene_type:complete
MEKKILLLLFFVFTVSCGYEPMLSKKNTINYNFSISELELQGDRIVNLKVKEKLNSYKINKLDKDFVLKIKTTSKKIILAKNLKGDPTNFKNTTTLNVNIIINDNVRNKLVLEASTNYKNSKDKFKLRNYEKEIKRNLAETITNKLIYKLSNIQ